MENSHKIMQSVSSSTVSDAVTEDKVGVCLTVDLT